MKLIVTIAPSKAKAFQLFEILNDRGRSLEPLDLIKNHFLKILNTEGKPNLQVEVFTQNWKSFMDNLQISPKKRINSSTFMKHFVIAFFGENISKDDLFSFFTEKNKNTRNLTGNDIIDLSKKLSGSSSIYRDISKGNFESYIEDNNMYTLFKILSINQLHPLLMAFYDDTPEKKNEVLDYAVRLGAATIFSWNQTNEIEKILSPYLKKYLDENKSEEAYLELLSNIQETIDSFANELQKILPAKNLANNSGGAQTKASLILKFIELYFNDNILIKSLPNKDITVEHMLPRKLDYQKYSKEMDFDNEKDYMDHLNLIGNLTLLTQDDNSSANNKTMIEKKAIYMQSKFLLTESIFSKLETPIKSGKKTDLYHLINRYEKQYAITDHWKKELIIQRSEHIATLLHDVLVGIKTT